jgi:NTE family protein
MATESTVDATMESKVKAFSRAGRSGIGICLSGGGFRASLFHLGALRRIYELGILQKVRWISGVSGGSIIAGHLAQCQIERGRDGKLDFENWQRDVSDTFRAFAARDLRTWPVIRHCLWNWFAPAPLLKSLEARYRTRLTRLGLRDLPQLPEYIFSATDLTFGVNWVFQRSRVGSYQAGYISLHDPSPHMQNLTVAKAITASACFPPLLGPMRAGIAPSALVGGKFKGPNRDRLVSGLSLSDGGVYDNMATEPVWKDAATVLVSDCGAPFQYEVGQVPWRTLLRYSSALSRQSDSLRIRMLQTVWSDTAEAPAFNGTRWHIAAGATDKSAPLPGRVGYKETLAKSSIATIRTDLDAFSEGEMSILENHGYCNADYQLRLKMPALVGNSPPVPPYADWMDEQKAKDALRDSGKRFTLRRLLTDLLS